MTNDQAIERGCRDGWVRIYPPQADLVQQADEADGRLRRPKLIGEALGWTRERGYTRFFQ